MSKPTHTDISHFAWVPPPAMHQLPGSNVGGCVEDSPPIFSDRPQGPASGQSMCELAQICDPLDHLTRDPKRDRHNFLFKRDITSDTETDIFSDPPTPTPTRTARNTARNTLISDRRCEPQQTESSAAQNKSQHKPTRIILRTSKGDRIVLKPSRRITVKLRPTRRIRVKLRRSKPASEEEKPGEEVPRETPGDQSHHHQSQHDQVAQVGQGAKGGHCTTPPRIRLILHSRRTRSTANQ